MVTIPWKDLSPEALQGLIEAFVAREGTDYGDRNFTLEEKVAHVRRQLEKGTAVIVYDAQSLTANIIPADQLKASRR